MHQIEKHEDRSTGILKRLWTWLAAMAEAMDYDPRETHDRRLSALEKEVTHLRGTERVISPAHRFGALLGSAPFEGVASDSAASRAQGKASPFRSKIYAVACDLAVLQSP